ncbi:ankyrin domain protein (macronuclear) [Tetrahymena thermophila SB210]|uniref:Ankyrin domain protein n=1 Tax=Tetrahymena thermophila (strain SB210) TaxID=312017 RepID=Q22BC5_TETTS|nr:ankyrin domain protein [Tetrahymena thermophila SB210]EAR82583.2 ankyrin domain protein [Tetrahymena thermophila SB210]|eukprot:XP_001030246.2 ankyrin domain protein [Tetrahymena thermophila SB210]
MYVRLSELFTNDQQEKDKKKEKQIYRPAGSSIYEDSMIQIEDFNTMRESKSSKNIINKFKQQIKNSVDLLNSPKSNLFGRDPVIKWSSQNFFKQTKKYYNQVSHHNLQSNDFHNQAMQTGFSKASSQSYKQRTIEQLDPLKQAKSIIQNGKIDSADWANLKESIDEQLSRKAHTLQTKSSYPSINVANNYDYNKKISMKDRINTMNNQFYQTKLVFSDSFEKNQNNQQRKDESSRYLYDNNTLRSSFGKSSNNFFAKQDQNNFKNKKDLFKSIQTEQSDEINQTAFHANQKVQHKMQSSICIAQIKLVKGGYVKKKDKVKFQNYYDSVSERLEDIKHGRSLNKLEFTKMYDFNWQNIKYQPANQKEDLNLNEIKKLYLRDRNVTAQSQIDINLTKKEKEEQQKQLKIQKQKEDRDIQEYKKKTMFSYKNYEEEQEKEQSRIKIQNLNETDNSIDYDKLFNGISSKDTVNNFEKERYKKIRKLLRESLWKHYALGVTIKEAIIHNIFKRVPFSKPIAEDFFTAVKSNEIQKVQQYLIKDKYLVYQFDSTLQTPLHWAAKRGFLQIAEMLISKNCDVDSRDELGRTPLYFAYREGHNQMGKLLLLQKASPWSNKKNNIDLMVYSRDNNDKQTIKIAKQIHLMMMMAKFKQKQKIWDDTKYLFEDRNTTLTLNKV